MPTNSSTGREVIRTQAHALTPVLAAAAVPYGVTTVVASEILLLRHYHHEPSVALVFAFALASALGYTCLAVLCRGDSPPPLAGDLRRSGALNCIAITTTVGVAAGIARLPALLAWPLVSAAGIVVYLFLVSLQYAFVRERRIRRAKRRPSN
jgi:hypothetical protein